MIYCFSGTGNTRHIAEGFGRRTGMEVYHFKADDLRNPSAAFFATSDRLIVWAFPTYSWGVPPVVRQIIRNAKCNFPSDAIHIALTTCGDDIGNMAKMFRRDIRKRGWRPGAVYSVIMPNTYVMMKGFDTDPENVARRKLEQSLNMTERIASAVNAGKTAPTDDIVVRGRFAAFKTNVIYPWFVRFDMSPKGFRVDAAKCIGCGKCARVCPMDNINYNAAKLPEWGNSCAFCTACYHVCPVHAVGWKKTTSGKGQVKYFND